jgi:hypothetical protein
MMDDYGIKDVSCDDLARGVLIGTVELHDCEGGDWHLRKRLSRRRLATRSPTWRPARRWATSGPVALGRHDVDQRLAGHGFPGFAEDSGSGVQRAGLLGLGAFLSSFRRLSEYQPRPLFFRIDKQLIDEQPLPIGVGEHPDEARFDSHRFRRQGLDKRRLCGRRVFHCG